MIFAWMSQFLLLLDSFVHSFTWLASFSFTKSILHRILKQWHLVIWSKIHLPNWPMIDFFIHSFIYSFTLGKVYFFTSWMPKFVPKIPHNSKKLHCAVPKISLAVTPVTPSWMNWFIHSLVCSFNNWSMIPFYMLIILMESSFVDKINGSFVHLFAIHSFDILFIYSFECWNFAVHSRSLFISTSHTKLTSIVISRRKKCCPFIYDYLQSLGWAVWRLKTGFLVAWSFSMV